uniref:Uncharacterized protein n=1 Tax=Anguilla anguilla TaxID=7936 RepID=A0A0E9QB37_ANGAN
MPSLEEELSSKQTESGGNRWTQQCLLPFIPGNIANVQYQQKH